uniref:Uncharacterized protein n=1 Tax=Oryza glumipatula TaxID=40148 RepID=A0A0D9YLR1_9ORYZ
MSPRISRGNITESVSSSSCSARKEGGAGAHRRGVPREGAEGGARRGSRMARELASKCLAAALFFLLLLLSCSPSLSRLSLFLPGWRETEPLLSQT